jgi:hypothetical protein
MTVPCICENQLSAQVLESQKGFFVGYRCGKCQREYKESDYFEYRWQAERALSSHSEAAILHGIRSIEQKPKPPVRAIGASFGSDEDFLTWLGL